MSVSLSFVFYLLVVVDDVSTPNKRPVSGQWAVGSGQWAVVSRTRWREEEEEEEEWHCRMDDVWMDDGYTWEGGDVCVMVSTRLIAPPEQ